MRHIVITQKNTQYLQVYILNPRLIHLFVTTFLTLFLKVFNLQGKVDSKSAGNWFQFMMVLFTNVSSVFPTPNFPVMILPTQVAWP
jgi:hypothetical protein